MDEAGAGDILWIAGGIEAGVSDTIASIDVQVRLVYKWYHALSIIHPYKNPHNILTIHSFHPSFVHPLLSHILSTNPHQTTYRLLFIRKQWTLQPFP